MVHVAALPGTPKSSLSIERIAKKAVFEAKILESADVDMVMIENMHDRPYLNRSVGPEIIASMTAVAVELKKNISIPLGIQILAGANKEALAVALAAGLEFVRAEGFVFGHLSDEGWMNSDAGELLRYRKYIGAEHVQIFTDVKKKHSSHAATSDVSVVEMAKAAEFFLSDGIVITGKATGEMANAGEVKEVSNATSLPVIIGSGINADNIHDYWNFANAFIVGSSFKKDGKWENEMDENRVKKFMFVVNQLRSNNL